MRTTQIIVCVTGLGLCVAPAAFAQNLPVSGVKVGDPIAAAPINDIVTAVNEAAWDSADSGVNVYRSTGNVGIGTSNPLDELHIVDNVPGFGLGRVSIRLEDQVAPTASWLIQASGESGLDFIENTLGTFVLELNSNGNVGIGEGNPQAKLDVGGNVRVSGQVGIGTSTPDAGLHIAVGGIDPNASADIVLEDNVFSEQKWRIKANNQGMTFVDDTNDSTVLHLDRHTSSLQLTRPKVGINTASPAATLHIKAGINPRIRLERDLPFPTTNQQWQMRLRQSDEFVFEDVTGDVNNVLALEAVTGDIGIGDVNPDADLDIQRGSTWSRINVGASTFTTSSSRTLKENIWPVEVADILDKVADVPVNTYDWRREAFGGDESERTDRLGLIAEDSTRSWAAARTQRSMGRMSRWCSGSPYRRCTRRTSSCGPSWNRGCAHLNNC